MKAKATIGILLILLGGAFQVFSQMTAYANIYAEVVAPIGIEKTTDLTFSDINTSRNTGTVVIGANNIVTATGAEVAQSGKGTLASFSVAGVNTTFDVTLPKETFAVSNGSSNTMIVSDFTSTSSLNTSIAGSSRTIHVGATINIPENQASGNYIAQNPFLVTLNYN